MKGRSAVLLSMLTSLPDDELMELGKPLDDVDIRKLPTMKKILGIDEDGK